MNAFPLRGLVSMVAALGLLAFSGCASFERDWKKAELRPALRNFAKTDVFTGRWDGHWTSAKHKTRTGPAGGRLRCLLTKLDERRYEARFKANWMVFTSSYTTIFQVEPRRGELGLKGEHTMSAMFGGTYRYEGRVTPRLFSASYDSSYDRGTFEMGRPDENPRPPASGR